MSVPFEIEWMGGAAEHHYRKVRPAVEDLAWGTLRPTDHPPAAVEFARVAWTEVAINEYRAAAAFTEVVRALLDAKAPLDLTGMASDFLADECSHVEMASRLAMELGGGVERVVDPERFAMRPGGLTAFERANEVLLRVSCIEEAFSGGTANVSMQTTSHSLVHSVYETILRDEARHRRLGGLYFEWALARIDERERLRLGRVLFSSLSNLAFFWKAADRSPKANVPAEGIRALGWLEPARFAVVAREIVIRDILDPLATIGITITDEERATLMAPPSASPSRSAR
jgi:hypothetical protein